MRRPGFDQLENVLLALAALAVVSSLLLYGGCGAREKTAERSWFDCETAYVKSQVPKLAPAAQKILEHGAGNWRDQLEALGRGAGEAALACSVAAAAEYFNAPRGFTAIAAPPNDRRARGATNAAAAIAEHAWAFRAKAAP